MLSKPFAWSQLDATALWYPSWQTTTNGLEKESSKTRAASCASGIFLESEIPLDFHSPGDLTSRIAGLPPRNSVELRSKTLNWVS